MKNMLKVFGIIALAAILGFAVFGCKDGDEDGDDPVVAPPDTGLTSLVVKNFASKINADKTGEVVVFTAAATDTNSVSIIAYPKSSNATATVYKFAAADEVAIADGAIIDQTLRTVDIVNEDKIVVVVKNGGSTATYTITAKVADDQKIYLDGFANTEAVNTTKTDEPTVGNDDTTTPANMTFYLSGANVNGTHIFEMFNKQTRKADLAAASNFYGLTPATELGLTADANKWLYAVEWASTAANAAPKYVAYGEVDDFSISGPVILTFKWELNHDSTEVIEPHLLKDFIVSDADVVSTLASGILFKDGKWSSALVGSGKVIIGAGGKKVENGKLVEGGNFEVVFTNPIDLSSATSVDFTAADPGWEGGGSMMFFKTGDVKDNVNTDGDWKNATTKFIFTLAEYAGANADKAKLIKIIASYGDIEEIKITN